jgi:hypothetical protein
MTRASGMLSRRFFCDRLANEGGFNNCFEMEDRHDVILTICEEGYGTQSFAPLWSPVI